MKNTEEKNAACMGENQPEKKKEKVTELVFIIDKSGSMSGYEADTIGGFNSTIEKQKEEEGKVYVSTVLFNNRSTVVHDRVELSEIKPMTRRDYYPSGSTALLDALGDAISHISTIHKYARPEDVPEHTVFVITTDGMENSSHHYSSDEVKEKIKQQTEEYGWEFIFLAANIDAVETAKRMGIRHDRAANFRQSSDGIGSSYYAMCRAISSVRKDRASSIDLNAYLDEKNNKKK